MEKAEHQIRRALARVVSDIRSTTPFEHATGTVVLEADGEWLVELQWNDGSVGQSVEYLDDEWLAREIADLAQNDLERDLREPWPKCPSHRHALIPTAEGDKAVWACPNGELSLLIGQLKPNAVGSWSLD